MPDRDDYGRPGSETALIPGALIAYRHFMLRDGRLQPMSGGDHYHIPVSRFEARCARDEFAQPFCWHTVFEPDQPACGVCGSCKLAARYAKVPGGHVSPHVDCTCGFYAHYSPATDFYPTTHWAVDRPSGLIVRAVVELSGTIVMGSRGVRAQRLTIKALSVDWGKHPSSDYYLWEAQFDGKKVERLAVDQSIAVKRAGQAAALAANLYGADYYAAAALMYEAWPQPDLTGLGITPAEPEPPPERLHVGPTLFHGGSKPAPVPGFWRQIATQFQQAATSLQPFVDAVNPADQTELTPFQKALQAKKRRPAPPGTGINYRRKK
ncbi:hypothetical protein [Streptomyces sp. NPDC055085]